MIDKLHIHGNFIVFAWVLPEMLGRAHMQADLVPLPPVDRQATNTAL